MKTWISLLACSVVVVLTLSACSSEGTPQSDEPFDWRSDWVLESDFSISMDTDGYQIPTAIAFIPDPGELPEDPLYFVTELRGKVKVVTNDRTVYTFAQEFFELTPKAELPRRSGQIGMAGICLDPQRGYVFVTFAYEDAEGVVRNNIVRFQTTPIVFDIKPSSQVAFTDIFASYESKVSHQIGPCQIDGDLLYVSIGEARQPLASQRLDTLLGKIGRMTLDGRPVKDNPFYQDNDVTKARNYVWAYGLRNPFGLKIVEGGVFVADNGRRIDRFLQARKGENYLWDGNDASMGIGADLVISPGNGVAQLDYYLGGSLNFPQQLADSFFLTITGNMEYVVPADAEIRPSVLRFKYGLDESALQSVPETFLRYRGNTGQIISGVQLGPDGLYFVPLLPNQDGVTAIYKVIYEPGYSHRFLVDQGTTPGTLMRGPGCLGCHTLQGTDPQTVGPSLDSEILVPRLVARLNSQEYLEQLREVDLLDREPFISYEGARADVRQAEGLDRVRTWIRYRIMEPRFDDPDAQMPNLGLSETDATIIADFLAGIRADEPPKRIADRIRDVLPKTIRSRHLALFFIGGFLLGAVGLASTIALVSVIRRVRAKGGG